jgi:hypothetical protein
MFLHIEMSIAFRTDPARLNLVAWIVARLAG